MMTTEEQERVAEGLLGLAVFLLSYFTVIAFKFIQLLSSVVQDPDHIFEKLFWVFVASILCNIVGLFASIALSLIFGRYHPSKKYTLVFTTAVSFLFMLYGNLVLLSVTITHH